MPLVLPIRQNFYGAGFVYSADRPFAASVKTPCLVLAGNDDAHPLPLSDACAKLLPNVDDVLEWKSGNLLLAAQAKIKSFLAYHPPRSI